MTTPSNAPARPRVFWLGLLALAMVAACFFAQAWRGLNLWDEGFYWYGAQRVLAGDVPIRDFRAYDPGRYYWAAALMKVWGGTGIVALRAAAAAAQAIGLFTGCLLVARAAHPARQAGWLLLAAVTLLAWLTPSFKTCDFAVSIGLVAALTHLAACPNVRRHFIAGAAVGLAAVFGRNHGVYGLGGSVIVMALLVKQREPGCTLARAFGAWAGGIVVGYLPILAMVIGCPGFARPFWDSIWNLVETRTFNLPLPVRWPWRVHLGQMGAGTFVQDLVSSWFYVGLLAFGIGGLVWAARRAWRGQPITPGLVASIGLSLPYAHYAFARADAEHMALGIFPTLIGVLIWLTGRPAPVRWIGGSLLAVASLVITTPSQPLWKSWRFHWQDTFTISGETIVGSPEVARDVRMLRALKQRYAPNGETFLAMPFLPGSYGLLERRAPVWDTYVLLQGSEAYQRQEVQQLEATPPAFVVLQDIAFDEREDMRFRNLRPMLYRYLQEHFQRVTDLDARPEFEILVPRRPENTPLRPPPAPP